MLNYSSVSHHQKTCKSFKLTGMMESGTAIQTWFSLAGYILVIFRKKMVVSDKMCHNSSYGKVLSNQHFHHFHPTNENQLLRSHMMIYTKGLGVL